MTPAERARTAALFRQAQIHLGIGIKATPAETAMACLRQAAVDVQACIAADPSIRLTLPVPVGLLEALGTLVEEE